MACRRVVTSLRFTVHCCRYILCLFSCSYRYWIYCMTDGLFYWKSSWQTSTVICHVGGRQISRWYYYDRHLAQSLPRPNPYSKTHQAPDCFACDRRWNDVSCSTVRVPHNHTRRTFYVTACFCFYSALYHVRLLRVFSKIFSIQYLVSAQVHKITRTQMTSQAVSSLNPLKGRDNNWLHLAIQV